MSAISYIGIQGLRGPQGEKGDPGVGTDAVLSVNGELPDENGNVVIHTGGATEGPFVTALPLTGRLVMTPTVITGPVAFTVGLTPGLMVETYVKLTADGTNTPTFAGMTEWGGSLGWDNTAGMVNNLAFFNDGTTTYYSIAQDLGATPIPIAPGIPTLSLGTVSDTSIGLTWTLPGGGTPTDYIVEFRLVAGTWATFTDGVSTTRSATVTGLTANTAYEFRVSAQNEVGTSGTSNVISESTAIAGVAPGIPTLSLGAVSTTDIGLTWTLPSGGVPTDYIVEYRLTAGTWGTFADGVSTTRSATVTGLTANTGYEFRVSATNAVGTSGTSNVVTGTTEAAASLLYPRLSATWKMTETGNAETGWIYTGVETGSFSDVGVCGNDPILSGDDGWFGSTCVEGGMIGLAKAITTSSFSNPDVAYVAYVSYGNISMKRGDTGTNLTPSTGATSATGKDLIRLRIAGSDVYAEYSVDDGANWTIFDQTTKTVIGLTGDAYPWISSSEGIVIGPLLSEGTS